MGLVFAMQDGLDWTVWCGMEVVPRDGHRGGLEMRSMG